MSKRRFDHYYRYEELTRELRALVKKAPHLLQMSSIGRSHEGRDVWMITATNFASGTDAEKPALWVDGNLHATEVAGSAACMYLIHALVNGYGKDRDISACLDTRAFYIVPRVNPDGAEWALADKPRYIRSSTRAYPYEDEPVDGLFEEDLDGDGRILKMRIPDANGAWKKHPQEPRLMIRREPAEFGGEYYRMLSEGSLRDYDGVSIQPRKPQQGLDLNRNFPVAWRQESEQPGAGPYPASEPETRNLVDFITRHANVSGVVTFHTCGGVLLRPYDDRPDDAMLLEDLWTFKRIGEEGTRRTGYPNISIYHDFRDNPREITTGGFDTWMYEQRGVFAWTVEIWSVLDQAGLKDFKLLDWFREHPLEDDLKLMKWNDESLQGKGFVDWYPFTHPQLGKVELGGWDGMHAWDNPPGEFLEKELERFPAWILWQALISPRLGLHSTEVKALGKGAWSVRLVVENTGWLPTYITRKALEKRLVRGVIGEIELPEGAALRAGKRRDEFTQLEGRAYKTAFLENADATDDRLKIEWVIHAPQGGVVKMTARHERAGVVRAEVELK